jgi:rfaE bifunctional protein nucleotidyltransferase chain/domain
MISSIPSDCNAAPAGREAGKIKDLPELAAILARHKEAGRRVVLCHGVFDPLHIGHIKHFQQARKLGQVLAVTVTPDRFVNKGPHRPVFPEQLRAEAVAALECVDYVAVNQWPMAIEAIGRLKPDLFVKGSEFQHKTDRTGAIALEEQAVKAAGGALAFTEDLTFSASGLVNRHFPVFTKEVSAYLADFAQRFGAEVVLRYLAGIRPLKILVVGEAIIDEYHYCEAIGKSSKEPTLVVKALSQERFAGGALAAANHLAQFCDHVSLVSMLGDQGGQGDLLRGKLHPAVWGNFISRKDSPTIVKRRFIEHYFFTKLFEVYEINDTRLAAEDDAAVCAALRGRLSQFDLVIVLDFGHEMLSPQAVRILCDEARFLALNAQTNAGNLGFHAVSKYPRADYLCVAENEIRLDARDRRGELRPLLENLARRLGCKAAMVTRGNRGCMGFSVDEGIVEVPAFAGKVVDRIGAGDAFMALTAPCIVQRAPIEVAGLIGNAVGAQMVATVGNREPVSQTGLVRYIEHLLK